MISDARGGHVSPGIYTEEKDVTYSVKSLGITSLGLVGETLYGPAFENIEIKDWSEFVDYFGGTSPEKFKGTGLPKYELPYIAKSYLEQSKSLNVVRVLGLSGYDAGEAYVIKSKHTGKPGIILRSKMTYDFNPSDYCKPNPEKANPVVKSVEIGPYVPAVYNSLCQPAESTYVVDINNKFSLIVNTYSGFGYSDRYVYNVSLNESDSDYIYRVISSDPSTGTTPIYIEALYESAFESEFKYYKVAAEPTSGTESGTERTYYDYACDELPEKPEDMTSYNTLRTTDSAITENGLRVYSAATPSEAPYTYVELEILDEVSAGEGEGESGNTEVPALSGKTIDGKTINDYFMNFKEEYRPAQTPWFVSEAYASTEGEGESATTKVTMKKLFKFITISDGDAANYQVKVSIQNIKPEDGTFDVVVRDFNDTDVAPIILERFTRCSLVEGSSSYLAYKIGSFDGGYVSRSKFITVEMADGEDLSGSIPCGFIGYPILDYTDVKVRVGYNTVFNPSLKAKRQYFGGMDDIDIIKYKGKYAYDNQGDADPDKITNGFHMDSIIFHASADTVYVDGVNNYVFDTVSVNKVTSDDYEPRMINASYINNTIYKDINTRKFTVYFYGGFDGWDINREARTNTDEYKATKYAVKNSDVFTNVETNGLNRALDLPSTAITSDYYAYLAGYRVFANPQDVDINLLATPGIDWYNNNLLVEDVIDIVEDRDNRGGDVLYVMNSPFVVDGEMLSPSELADEFVSREIDSSYVCTYYPWIMYYDSSNKRYVNLSPTKDVVRDMAETDNNFFPWFAPAGMQRGEVNCIKAAFKTTLDDEDTLYENMINPVKTFAKDGVKIWGNKTAYRAESPLNRINVRRLMIRVKKLVTEAAKDLIFEQYDDTLEKQFRGLVEPILADVKSNRGIYDYRVITEVTEETRDQHILPAKILIKPTPTLEYISISFVVYPESVSFESES